MIKVKHATEFFQHLLMTESIYFSPSKINQTQIDLHKSVQKQVMKILQWVTHEKMRLRMNFIIFRSIELQILNK